MLRDTDGKLIRNVNAKNLYRVGIHYYCKPYGDIVWVEPVPADDPIEAQVVVANELNRKNKPAYTVDRAIELIGKNENV